jgi:IS4 transposase
MNTGKTVLAQILEGLHPEEFRRCAERHPTQRDTPALSAYDHFVVMVFSQITNRDSLRSIELCLSSRKSLLYHAGIRGNVTRTNLSYANEKRPWELFAEIAEILMRRAKRLYREEPLPIELDGEIFAIDSSLIDLSMKLFPWAAWQKTQASVKLHVMLSLRGDIPAFVDLTTGNRSDVEFLDLVPIKIGSYYVIDRGYVDLWRLYRIHTAAAWFVTRLKRNIRWYTKKSTKLTAQQWDLGVRSDQIIVLKTKKARKAYPTELRRVRFKDPETGKSLVFLTNNLVLAAEIIALIYKNRWRIEIYFKWLKQNLKIRGFYSLHPNGVRVQIWTALCAFLLVVIAKQHHQLPGSLHLILENLSIASLEKVPLAELFADLTTSYEVNDNQMSLAL